MPLLRSRLELHTDESYEPSIAKGEQNGCRQRLEGYLSCHRWLPAPPGAALRVAFNKLCRLMRAPTRTLRAAFGCLSRFARFSLAVASSEALRAAEG